MAPNRAPRIRAERLATTPVTSTVGLCSAPDPGHVRTHAHKPKPSSQHTHNTGTHGSCTHTAHALTRSARFDCAEPNAARIVSMWLAVPVIAPQRHCSVTLLTHARARKLSLRFVQSPRDASECRTASPTSQSARWRQPVLAVQSVALRRGRRQPMPNNST